MCAKCWWWLECGRGDGALEFADGCGEEFVALGRIQGVLGVAGEVVGGVQVVCEGVVDVVGIGEVELGGHAQLSRAARRNFQVRPSLMAGIAADRARWRRSEAERPE